jgi:hypothetical protein
VRDRANVPYELYGTFDALFRNNWQNDQYGVLLSVLENPEGVRDLDKMYGISEEDLEDFDAL